MRLVLLLSAITLLLAGCLERAPSRIGLLVLLPLLLVMVVLWLLNRHREEEPWEDEHFPDEDDADNEDHHLM
jgi:Ca2+/Na+ antiporter